MNLEKNSKAKLFWFSIASLTALICITLLLNIFEPSSNFMGILNVVGTCIALGFIVSAGILWINQFIIARQDKRLGVMIFLLFFNLFAALAYTWSSLKNDTQ